MCVVLIVGVNVSVVVCETVVVIVGVIVSVNVSETVGV